MLCRLYDSDIVCLTDVLPKKKHLTLISSYDLHYHDVLVTSDLRYRGICLFCKSDLHVCMIEKVIEFDEYIFL